MRITEVESWLQRYGVHEVTPKWCFVQCYQCKSLIKKEPVWKFYKPSWYEMLTAYLCMVCYPDYVDAEEAALKLSNRTLWEKNRSIFK